MKRPTLALSAGVAVTVALAVGGGFAARAATPTPAPVVGAAAVTGNPADLAFDIRGSLTLHDLGAFPRSGTCAGSGGYSDIRGGTNVTVWNADGKIVGAGMLDSGVAYAGDCVLSWSVRNVPAGQGPYQYEISHRGRLTMTEDQARLFPMSELGR